MSWLPDRRAGTPEGPSISAETLRRPAAIVGLLAIALIHFLDLFGTMKDHVYIGVLYMVLIAACLVAASALLGRRPRRALLLTAAVATGPFLACVLSRSGAV